MQPQNATEVLVGGFELGVAILVHFSGLQNGAGNLLHSSHD